DALPLVAQDKRAEARDLHILADRECMAHVVKNALDHARRLGARQAEPAMNDVGEVGASQRSVGVRVLVDPRDPEIGDDVLPPSNGANAPFRLHFRNGNPSCRQFNNRRIFQFFQYLSAAAPHVNPPHISESTTTSPLWIRPSFTAVSSASGTEAADVLACWSTVTTTFSAGKPN